ncbi:aliphatic sulfonate ABC transporter substrate-binding protein [Fictibacillus nanhaiensis]|uniref:aliphatic sulfonate ABC transporter substrate-binding protein n=1 Tax=Fictibacillus nanhaiensis TaxID=742169 RepID=UPI001C98283D|nr:aliphatic sulfonate ABC transporter substrate-binding protein [Fictibacillus nanhaiensis]MBY6037790.1 aliphatic sulfonate ABC transporter substrate-binding protein [Fictibacillus nanhaiensis]
MKIEWRVTLLFSLLGVLLFAGCSSSAKEAGEKPKKIRLDYAYYSPTSLALKKFGWVEEAFEKEGIEVEWVLSQGSNKALEFLNSDSVDFGSTAGAAALIAKDKGAPIESVYIYSQPEWTALVAKGDSPIKDVKNLKGKKVAATIGTDPYIFLLRALDEAGLSAKDVQIVNLQHADGANALLKGQVDAWAGLDPHMARVELESDGTFIYRNPDFNTYGTLNVRSEFAKNYPEQVAKVIELYEKAREWTVDNPDKAAKLLSEEAGIKENVAKKGLERNNFSQPVPGKEHEKAIAAAGKVLQTEEIVKKDTDIEKLAKELINSTFAEKVIKK